MEKITQHLNQYNFDIRKSRDARFMDQKVTPDVLCIIADCVLEFTKGNISKNFCTTDIWQNDYINENIKDIYNKPDVFNKSAKREYDKFFAQPLRMLAYARILNLVKQGNKNIFSINNKELLEYISIKERNSLNFIILYLEKVLRDSGIFYLFENFFNNNTKENFLELKSKYEEFIINNTAIKKNLEVRRIFTKVLNPLAFSKKSCGTKGGCISKDTINYDELMYNRRNWRDVSKIKEETRQDYEDRAKDIIKMSQNAFVKFTVYKAKRLIRERYRETSEIQDEYANGQATQVHHIFPQSDYPEIKSHLENLILLTATQHSTKAHPNNNTNLVDKDYQYLCLLSKSNSIRESVEIIKDGFYSKDDFIFVLNKGIKPSNDFDTEKSFDEINKIIAFEYHKK
jgi:hypothetical protein